MNVRIDEDAISNLTREEIREALDLLFGQLTEAEQVEFVVSFYRDDDTMRGELIAQLEELDDDEDSA